jgi:hypothetical protein
MGNSIGSQLLQDESPINVGVATLQVLQQVWAVYGNKSARSLSQLTHCEAPWLRARQGLPASSQSSYPISPDEMHRYYQQFVALDPDTGKGVIPLEVLRLDKEAAFVMPTGGDRPNLVTLVQQLQSLQPLRSSPEQRQAAHQALQALAERRSRSPQERRAWAEQLAADVAHSID